MNALKKNIFFKGVLTFSNYIIGFATFPYITRVLGPNNFGLVNFALNTVDYFLLFATMGIATIGTREIAAVKGNKYALDKVFSKVLGTNLFFTVISLLIFFLCVNLIPRLSLNKELFYIGSVKIIFTAFTIEWLYTGLENFKYITIRSLFIRLIYIISVFIFVKHQSDYILYFALTIGVVAINAIVNTIYSRKFVRLVVRSLKSTAYLKQNIQLGLYSIMTSMYITFNIMYLGLVGTDQEVGYYATAVKLYFIAVSMFSAFTSVMLPRISALSANNEVEKIQMYVNKSFQMVFLTAFPIVILSLFFAPEIIEVMSGSGYDLAITPMRILMPALIFVWFSQIIVFQSLIPDHHDKILLSASIIGGSLAIIVNLLVTPHLFAVGSALTLLICEMVVTIYYLFIVKLKKLMVLPNLKSIIVNIVLVLPYVAICFISNMVVNGVVAFIIATIISLGYFLTLSPLKRLRKVL